MIYFAEKKCDGIVHCIEGEDETFQTCTDEFPEEATINCNERPTGYDIWDMAVPCNEISECVDGKDEFCDENRWILVGVVLTLIIITNIIYHYLKWYCLSWNLQTLPDACHVDEWNSVDCLEMVGDQLANMKVTQEKTMFLYERLNCFVSRTLQPKLDAQSFWSGQVVSQRQRKL